MSTQLSDLTRCLAEQAEAVCRHYLSNGRRVGGYWIVGDARNTPGRSMFVRLNGCNSGKGARGKWTDAATGEHGDLLDVIQESRGLVEFSDVVEEAQRFLGLPAPASAPVPRNAMPSAPAGSPESARRLFAISEPIAGTIAETYLRRRGITTLHEVTALRFHPRCYYRPDVDAGTEVWPALVAAVTDLAGVITGVHRTWLDPSGNDKAPIDTPRRAMGRLLGHGVRFGVCTDVMAAGEGIETMLSLRTALPNLPVVAALSANHLAALLFPAALRRLYVARDNDPAGKFALAALTERSKTSGFQAVELAPSLGDFNEDLRCFGAEELRAALRVQLTPEDVPRFVDERGRDEEGVRSVDCRGGSR
jgi:Toprim domain